MTASGSVVGAPVLLLSFLASIDLFSSSLINVASVARAGLRPAGSVYTHRRPKSRVIRTQRTGERMPWANPGRGEKPFFHEVSRAERPSQQGRKTDPGTRFRNRGQTGLPANFRQKAPEIHGSLVSPRRAPEIPGSSRHDERGSVYRGFEHPTPWRPRFRVDRKSTR